MLQGRQPYVYGDGSQERCFSHWRDVVEPLVRMATDPLCAGETFNLGPDDEVVTVLEVARRIATQLSYPLAPIFKPGRPREVKFAHCSAEKARRVLGYETRVTLDDGICETLEWIRKRGTRPFAYHNLDIEIESVQLPETWSRRLF
jgi:UDP-glucose 4-epimerase